MAKSGIHLNGRELSTSELKKLPKEDLQKANVETRMEALRDISRVNNIILEVFDKTKW
jgi:hypothetical protein